MKYCLILVYVNIIYTETEAIEQSIPKYTV